MKKQIKKLSLNKKTISNLSDTEMQTNIGGQHCHTLYCYTNNGKTCNKNCGY
jgi:natural product precursor